MKKIAIIGGSYLQLPIVLKAKELGYEVHCFAWRDGAVCERYVDFFYPISIIEKEEILKQCQRIAIQGIITIASDVAVMTVNYVASRMGLISNPDEYSEITTNKYLMRKCFMINNIPSPNFTIVGKSTKCSIADFKFPLIVKPTDRSGSRGVEKVKDLSSLEAAIFRAKKESFSNMAIIEEYVPGKEISVEAISYNGCHYILQITDKITTGEPYFVELEHHQPSVLSLSIQERVKKIVLNALDAMHIKYGASHSELKITEGGDICVIEIGARMGGDFIGSTLVKLSTGYDFLQGVIDIAMGGFRKPKILEQSYSGVYFLCKETEYLKTIIENRHLYPEIVKAEITNEELCEVKCSMDRSGYFIYKSDKKFTI
ncbi:ATP-grasp domain-containing protein [Butyricimonas paravirosa]|uniref:ATP-grasp domain-containing protein n=1 Tax=Butyricimonas paravirosa TaxID=1472417 RepID=UPI0022E836EC|nr:ATP-grasp domain-containing protein [Butyricimonas paravirosa]